MAFSIETGFATLALHTIVHVVVVKERNDVVVVVQAATYSVVKEGCFYSSVEQEVQFCSVVVDFYQELS